VVDVFSKYLWARPLKKKSAEEVKEAFSHIFKARVGPTAKSLSIIFSATSDIYISKKTFFYI